MTTFRQSAPPSMGAEVETPPATATRPPGPSLEAGSADWRAGFDEGYGVAKSEAAELIENAATILAHMDQERERYRIALERIARAESGVWGLIASDALRPSTPERRGST